MTRLGVAATALASVVTIVAVNGPVSAEEVGTDDIKLTASIDPRDVQVSYDPVNNRHLLVWDEDVVGGEKIRGQIVTAAGANFAGPFDIAGPSVVGGITADEAVVWDSARNRWIVVFTTDETALGARDIALNTVSAAGSAGTPVLVSDMGNTAGDVNFDGSQPDVAFNVTSDEVLVVWRGDDESTANGEEEIFGQRLTGATLAEVGTNDFRISTRGTNGDVSIDARAPSVAWSPTANSYGVVYEQLNTLTPEQIFGQAITAAGVPATAIAVSSTSAGTERSRPAIAANDTNGGFIAVWEKYDGALTQIEGKVIDSGFVAGATLPALSTTWADSGGVDVAYNPTVDRFGIVWHSDVDGFASIEYEIFGALVDPAGAVVEAVARLSTMGSNGVAASIPVYPSVDRSSGGSMQTVWISDNNDASATPNDTAAGDYEVFGQQFQVNGPPTVTVEQAVGQLDPTNGSTINFTASFSEAVVGFAAGDVTVTGTGSAGATVAISGTGPTYNIAVSGLSASGTVSASIAASTLTDAGGLPNAASTSIDNTVTRDVTAPTITINQRSIQADPTNTQPISFDVVASESVTGLIAADFSLTGTATGKTGVLTGGPVNFVLEVSATSSGTVIASLPAASAVDAAGNANTASTSTDNTVTLDTTSPTVTINQAAAQVDPTNAGPVTFTVVFSEPVTGFTASDVDVASSTTAGTRDVAVSGSGANYSVSVTGMSGTGNVVASIAAGAVSDASGNPNSVSTSTDNTVAFDAVVPTVSIVKAASQATPTNGSPIAFTVTFSEPVSGFAAADLDLSASTAGGTLIASVAGSGTTYTVSVTGMAGAGSVVASVSGAANDTAGNSSGPSPSSATVQFDAVAPTVTIEQAATQADPTNSAPVAFTVVFAESVTGFTGADVDLSASTVGGTLVAAVSGSGTTYTVSVTGMTGSGDVVASVPASAAADLATNANAASTSTDNTVRFDGDAPTVTIEQAAAQVDPTNVGPIDFAVVFSEPVTGFGGADVDLSSSTVGGTLTATVTGSGTTYTVSVAGMTGDGDVIAAVVAGAAVDASANASAASTSTDNTVVFDEVAPTVSIVKASAQTSPTNASPIEFTVTFSEAVTGFAAADVDLSTSTVGGSLVAVVSGSGTTYTVSVSGMTGTGSVAASISASAAFDVAGNTSTASPSSATVQFDAVAPTVTINQASSQADPTNVGPIEFTVVFSEPVTGFGPADVDLSTSTVGGTLVAAVSGSGTSYTVSVSGMSGDGTVVAKIIVSAATDSAGNDSTASTSTDNSVRFDNVAPTVTINQASSQTDPTNVDSVVFDVVFSELVAGFAAGDVELSASTTGGTPSAVVAGSGTTYTVTVTGMSGAGDVVATIGASAATEAAGNGNVASTSTDNVVRFDAVRPSVTVEQASGQSDPTNAGPIVFTATFAEPVSGLTDTDVVLGGTAQPATAVVTGGGTTWTLTVSGMLRHGTVTAAISADAAVDAAGNLSTASTSTDNVVTYVPGDPHPGVNDAPVVTSPGLPISAELGVAASFSGADSVSVVDADAFDDDLRVTLTTPAGTITAPATNGVVIAGSGTGTLTLTGSQTALNLALVGVQLTPTEVGSITLQVTADDLGHTPGPALTDVSMVSLTVADTAGPKITMSAASMTVNTDPGKAGAIVTYTASVSDTGSEPWSGQFTNAPAPSLSCAPASGAFFPIGVTTVTCTARDSVGNLSTGTMAVTVMDAERPVISIPATTQRVALPSGSKSGPIAYSVPTVGDNSGTATVTCTPAVGTVVPVGNVTVTCTAQDSSGMTQTESFVVVMSAGSLPATGGTLRLLPWAALVLLGGCALVIVTQRRRRLA